MIRATKKGAARLRLLSTVLLGATALSGGLAPAFADTEWEGSASSDWTDPANWDAGVPDGLDNVTVNGNQGSDPDINGVNADTAALLVGSDESGVLTIQNGGVLTTANYAYLASQSGSAGVVTVNGAGSAWNITNSLVVGHGGAGTLTISDGGDVHNDDGYIGYFAGASGAVTVDGASSSWVNNGDLFVGLDGDGELTVSNGGDVYAHDLNVGWSGEGTLTVSGDGEIDADNLYVGIMADSVGTVSFSGENAYLDVLQDGFIGQTGAGALSFSDGATAMFWAGDLTLGENTGGSGALSLSGTDTEVTVGGDLFVGIDGEGSLEITEGAVLYNIVSSINSGAGLVSTAMVAGPDSEWNNAGLLYVGGVGAGELMVADGGVVKSGDGIIGSALASTGVATIDGDGAAWSNSGVLNVGGYGDGSLVVTNGGVVSTVDLVVGYEAGSSGAISLSAVGSELAVTGTGVIGRSGAGGMTLADGAAFSVGGDLLLGELAGSEGDMLLSGAQTVGDVSGDLFVGLDGEATLAITEGASLSNAGAYIGAGAGLTSAVSVSGAGSSWSSDGILYVGTTGTGMLKIADGAVVTSAGGIITSGVNATGIVTIDGEGSAWNSDGNVHVGTNNIGSLTVSNGGLLSTKDGTGDVFVATSVVSEGVLNIGAAAGDNAAAAGSVEAASVTLGAGDATLVFNHTNSGYDFGVNIAGNGAVEIYSGETIYSGEATHTGSTTIFGGSLLVNGSINSPVTVNDGGTLGGSGMLDSVALQTGGVLAPGESIGVLNVGDLSFAAGSVLEVEIASNGDADLVNSSGTVTINGGEVRIIPYPDFSIDTPYTIITATGGVNGVFDDLVFQHDSIFIDAALSYDANNVFFTLAQTTSFDEVAVTFNQTAAAAALQALGSGDTLFDAIIAQGSEAEAQAAYDALSGEFHASLNSALIEDSRFVRMAVNARERSVFGGVAEGLQETGYGLWGYGYGAFGHRNSDANAAKMKAKTGGFIIGGDHALNDSVNIGAFAGYARSDVKVKDRASSGDANTFTLGLYGGGAWGAFGLSGGAAYSWHDVSTERSVVFTGFTDAVSADYDARTVQLFGEATYRIDAGAMTFEPYLDLSHVRLKRDAFAEAGGAAALTAAEKAAFATFSTVGLRGLTEVEIGGGAKIRLTGGAGWRHAYGSPMPKARLAFAGGNDFLVHSAPIADDAFVLDLGGETALSGSASLGFGYSGQYGSGFEGHAFKANLNIAF